MTTPARPVLPRTKKRRISAYPQYLVFDLNLFGIWFEFIWTSNKLRFSFLNFPIWFECIWHSNINWHNLKWFDWLCALIFLFDLNLFDFQILNEIIWTNLICLISVDEKFDLNQVEILVFLNLFDLIWRVARKLRK